MRLLAEDLARLCYNAIQFSSKDSSLKGAVCFDFTEDRLEVYASDDYVAMVDQAPLPDREGASVFHLGLKELKELEKWLRDKEGDVTLSFDLDQLVVVASGDDAEIQMVNEPPDFFPVVEVVWSEPNPFTGEFSPSAEPFAIRAERFTKFRLLRTPESPSCRDGYPVDFLWDGRVVRWKCGPYMKGVIGPLARYGWTDKETGEQVTGIKQLYADEEGVLW